MIEEKQNILKNLILIYKDRAKAEEALDLIEKKFQKYEKCKGKDNWVSEKDIILITYGDTLKRNGEKGLETLHKFLTKFVGDAVSAVHILPMYPYSSDDGFSVIDYKSINKEQGTWDDVISLSNDYNLMLDAVINHISKSSDWFQKFLLCEEQYKDYFIVSDPDLDYSQVVRPRTSRLLTPFDTKEGKKYVWTTFSDDQIDLNYKNINLLVEILDVLIMYAHNGAKFIRLDAVGYLWKEMGTSCISLKETHEVIKLMKKVLDVYKPGTILITETNVPHKENVSYFGNGDEAQLVYQFALPPLTMFSFLKEDASKLTSWAESFELTYKNTTYFNFLSSHDGIGLRPTEGILTDEERQFLVDNTIKNGGAASYKDNGDGTISPYELNINYQDALSSAEDSDEIRINRFISAETVLLSMKGVPGIYIHSLLGSRNDYYGKTISNIPRRINREKLDADKVESALNSNTNRNKIFHELLKRIRIRGQHSAFSPEASQKILELDHRIFAMIRRNMETGEIIYALINVSTENVTLDIKGLQGVDLICGTQIKDTVNLKSLQSVWIQSDINYK